MIEIYFNYFVIPNINFIFARYKLVQSLHHSTYHLKVYRYAIITPRLSLMENAFEQQVEKELKSMDQRLYDLEEKMTSIDTKLTQVVDAILGNALTKTGGFVADLTELKGKIKDLEDKIQKQEEFKKKFSWTVGIILGIGVLLQYLSTLYKNLKGI